MIEDFLAVTADAERSQMLSVFSKRLICRRKDVQINYGIEQKLENALPNLRNKS